MGGLFDTFNIGKRGLNLNQSAINVTSHNIANANTEGYSRQRAVVETTKPFGGTSRIDTCSVGQIGTGAEVTSIQRIRDYFIDNQVRSETGTSGYYTERSDVLSQVEDIFGEPSDTGIQELVNKFFSSFQEVSKSPDKSDVKSVAIQNASTLADALNYSYSQLEKMREDSQNTLRTDVTDINSYLDQINELNKQIGSISAVGQTANDLMDKRDNFLDELSSKFGLQINKSDLETINLSSTEYPDAALVKSDPTDTNYSRMSYVKSAATGTDASGNPTVTVEYYPLGNENSATKTFTITAADANEAKSLADSLTQNKILIGDKDGIVAPTNATQLKSEIFQTYSYESGVNSVDNNHVKGEIAGNQSVQAMIQGYMDNLDRLAAGLAYSVNAIQTGSMQGNDSESNEIITSQGLSQNLIFVTSGTSYTKSDGTTVATDDGITAATIKVNSDLIADPTKLNCSTTSTSGEGDGARAKAIANLNLLKMNLSSVGSTEDLTTMNRKSFLNAVGLTGFSDTTCLNLNATLDGSTVNSYYNSITNNIGIAKQEASNKADNQETILTNLNEQKASVSGVSLDEETTNLIQFQHAYQANAKIISTIDELLNVVINGLMK